MPTFGYEADAVGDAPLGRMLPHIVPAYDNRAAARRIEAGDGAQKGRFSRAVGTDNRDQLSGVDGQ